MIPLDYQTPEPAERTRQFSAWGPYFAGAVCALFAGSVIWISFLTLWPNGRWQILDLPDMDCCAFIGGIMTLALSAVPYELAAKREQAGSRHFVRGIIGGLFSFALVNFLQRAEDLHLGPSWLTPLGLGSLLAIPILLGCLSRRDAKRGNAYAVIIDDTAA